MRHRLGISLQVCLIYHRFRLHLCSEKQEKEEQQEKQNQEPPAKLKLEEKFEFLKNAPRAGSYTQDIQVHHRPLGIEVRLVIYCCRL